MDALTGNARSWRGRSPASAPAPISPATPANEAKDEQQYDCTYKSVDNQRDNSHTEMNVEPRQQPITDESAQQSNYQVPDQPESPASHHLSCQPTGNEPNQNNDQEALIRQMHGSLPKSKATPLSKQGNAFKQI
jgi:hypothetical protein